MNNSNHTEHIARISMGKDRENKKVVDYQGVRRRKARLRPPGSGGNGMNDNERMLIRNVCDSNLRTARQYARVVLNGLTAKKDAYFKADMLRKLDAKENTIELPHNVRGLLAVEDATNFPQERYLLRPEEEKAVERVLAVYRASGKLADLGISYYPALTRRFPIQYEIQPLTPEEAADLALKFFASAGVEMTMMDQLQLSKSLAKPVPSSTVVKECTEIIVRRIIGQEDTNGGK